jgi:hypothetical protein
MRWIEHAWEINAHNILIRISQCMGLLKRDLSLVGRIILKWILEKWFM